MTKSLRIIELTEWQAVTPAEDVRLKGSSLRDDRLAQEVAGTLRNRVDIREGYEGLELSTTSFVGSIEVGPLRILIRPKLPAMPLTQLFRYAYGLNDVAIFDETETSVGCLGLQDLLITMLAQEVELLSHGKFVRHYVPVLATLASPRGTVLLDKVARVGGITEAALPCRYFERQLNWTLNQILRTGLDIAARLTADRDLRRRVFQLADRFGDVAVKSRLDVTLIDRAERGLTRLTSAYRPALSLIGLLVRTLGVSFGVSTLSSPVPGFLFDMNVFFQRLLSRYLRENAIPYRVMDERAIGNVFAFATDGNPKGRSPPKPRPDYALLEGSALRAYLDAKYRDIWSRGVPANWLYQLSVYALASPRRTSVLLYASMSDNARDERLEIHEPVLGSGNGYAVVIIRPVPLLRLAQLVSSDGPDIAKERRRMAKQLLCLDVDGCQLKRFPK